MAQIVFLLFEDKQEPEDSEDRYKVEVHFTPGGKGREEIITGDKSVGSSTESLKADISKTRFYTSLKRMIPEKRQHKLPCPLARREAKTSCVIPLVETCGVKRTKSKSLPTLFYVPPSLHCQCPVEDNSENFTNPIDITQRSIPEALLDDSPIDKHPSTKSELFEKCYIIYAIDYPCLCCVCVRVHSTFTFTSIFIFLCCIPYSDKSLYNFFVKLLCQ